MSYDWGNGPPPQMRRSMQQYVLGGQGAPSQAAMFPSFSPAQYGLFGQNVPQGEDQLDWEKDSTNLVQDQIALLSDPMTAILSGEGGFAPQSFEPTVTYEQLPRPGYDFFARQINMAPQVDPQTGQPMIDPNTGMPVMGPAPEQTYQGIVADEIINQQGSSGSAMAKIKKMLQDFDEAGVSDDPEHPLRPQYEMLYNSLPSMQGEMAMAGEPPVIDWMQAQDDAENWELTFHEDPKVGQAGGVVYDEEGNLLSTGEGINEIQYDDAGNQILVKKVSEPTPTMELFEEYGIPLPTDRYEAADFMGPDWVAKQQRYGEAEAQAKAMQQMLRQGGTVGMTDIMGGKQFRNQRKALNQAEEDYHNAVKASYGQAPDGGPLPGPHEEGGKYANMNLDLLPPEWRADWEADRLRRQTEGPVNAEGTVGGQSILNRIGQAVGAVSRPGSILAGNEGRQASRLGYVQPGAMISSALGEAAGVDQEHGGPIETEEQAALKEQYRRLQKKKARFGEARESRQDYRQQYQGLQQDIQGAKPEIYNYEHGAALANEWILGQQQRTPYTDALMQRRMVPIATGIQTGAWMPTG